MLYVSRLQKKYYYPIYISDFLLSKFQHLPQNFLFQHENKEFFSIRYSKNSLHKLSFLFPNITKLLPNVKKYLGLFLFKPVMNRCHFPTKA